MCAITLALPAPAQSGSGLASMNQPGRIVVKISKSAMVTIGVATAITAGLVPATMQSAGASTTACASYCTSPYTQLGGSGEVLTVDGSTVDMAAASSTNTDQDWTVEYESSVSALEGIGLVSDRMTLNYGLSYVYQFEWAPDGQTSDQCLADSAAQESNPTEDENSAYYIPQLKVVLAQCGTTAATLWAADQNTVSLSLGYTDLINLGYEAESTFLSPTNNEPYSQLNSQYSDPAVLTVSGSTVALAPLTETAGVPESAQMWAAYQSPAEAQVQKAATQKSS
jgi:hypothetical protein